MIESRWWKWIGLLGGLVSASFLGACHQKHGPSEPVPNQKIRVVLSPHLSWGPLVLAQSEGFFAEEGLDVEFVTVTHSEESLVALLSGDVDVMPGPLHPGLFTAAARGGAIRIVAGMNYLARDGCTYHGLVLRAGLPASEALRRLHRLEASRDGSSRYLTSRMLRTQNIDIDQLETVRLPSAVIENSLEEGAVDAAEVTEPFVTRSSRHGTLWLRSQDATPGFQWAVISFGDRLLHRDRDVGVRFLAAFRRGIAQFQQGKTRHNLDLLLKATQEDANVLAQSCWPEFREDARLNLASVLEYQQWALDHRYVDVAATPEQLWDSSFVVASDTVLAKRGGEAAR